MFTLFHVGNNNIFMWFHEKNWIIRKLKILRKKSAILCNLPFWLEIHFDPYLKNQLTLQLLLYLFWKLFLWCLKRGLVGSYTYDTFNAILEKPSLIFYESVFTSLPFILKLLQLQKNVWDLQALQEPSKNHTKIFTSLPDILGLLQRQTNVRDLLTL